MPKQDVNKNPNLYRRSRYGFWVRLGIPCLKPFLWVLKKRSDRNKPLTVFQSYLVGDLFMALPALKILGRTLGLHVICRPDCVEILRGEGLVGIPFDNGFFVKPSFISFWRTARAAWNLRGHLGDVALDFDADPRSAFWLRLAGIRHAITYSRPYAGLFHQTFDVPENIEHQANKNLAVAEVFLAKCHELSLPFLFEPLVPTLETQRLLPLLDPATAPWIVSCWTRKDTKNWPLEHWEVLLEKLHGARLPLLLLEVPDADESCKKFLLRWSTKVGLIKGTLAQIAGHVQASAGVITLDHFFGHMAAHYGKRVLWINGSSNSSHVIPRGPNTVLVQIEPMPCRPCLHRCTNPNYKECLQALHPEQVWKAFQAMQAAR